MDICGSACLDLMEIEKKIPESPENNKPRAEHEINRLGIRPQAGDELEKERGKLIAAERVANHGADIIVKVFP